MNIKHDSVIEDSNSYVGMTEARRDLLDLLCKVGSVPFVCEAEYAGCPVPISLTGASRLTFNNDIFNIL